MTGILTIEATWRTPFTPTLILKQGEYDDDDHDGQMMSGDRLGLKFPDICLMGEEKPQKNLTQDTCPDRESNPGPLRERRIRYPLLHNG
ncbi:hypothetical protein C0J52_26150 [Blattella germanica]|nr:hypothetical protein C0J52_26150 [Blattella germanica]